MALRGDLASVDLAQVFQMLALNKKVGLLSIQSPRLCKVLYFDHRGVTLYYNPHALLDRAVATFIRVGRIQGSAVEEVREHASSNDLGLLDTLLAGGYLTESEFAAQMRYEVEEEVYELFFCKDARFEFLENVDRIAEREGVVDERFFFNTESLIMEAARRIDEWSYITERIPNGLEVFRRTRTRPDVEDIGEESAIVYDCVDGRHNVSRIVEASGLSSFAVFKSLSQLLDGAFVEQLPASELIALGQQCVHEGRPTDAINLFEKAIELDVGVPEVHSMAASAYQSTAEFENTIYHLKCAAEYQIASGDVRGAAEQLHAAAELVPTDLGVRERLVEIALTHANLRLTGFDPVKEGKELVGLLIGAGDLRRVRSILERLLTVRPDDLELKKILVSVHTKAGDQPRVIELYESIATTLIGQHRPIEAVAYLQKILMLDRSRADITERVRSLYAQDERSRGRRRARATMGAVSLLLVVLAVAYSFYDRAATDALEQIDVQHHVEANRYQQASAAYEQLMTEFPLTSAVGRAREELTRIDSLRLKHEATRLNREHAREREVERLRSEYKLEWRHHSELFLSGEPEAALAALERVRELLEAAGQPVDSAWAIEVQVDEALAKIRDFVLSARDLEQRHGEELAAGRLANAWTLAVELVTKYDITRAAGRTRVPVWIDSYPRGARIMRDGQSVQQEVGGQRRALMTPTVMLCQRDPVNIDLQVEGFEVATVEINPLEQASLTVSLQPVASQRIEFAEDAQTEIGVAGDWIVVGLRNGLVGIADARSGEVRHQLELGGLKEAQGAPIVIGDRTWFLTNEPTIECYGLESGRPADGWPARLSSAAQTALVARNGRLMFVDRDNMLCCYDQRSGIRLWQHALPASAGGAPMVEQRTVRIATTDGSLLSLDASDGSRTSESRSPAGVRTSIEMYGGTMFFGCADGKIRAVGKDGSVEWSADIGRVVDSYEFLVTQAGVFAVASGELLVRLDRDTGERVAATGLGGSLRGLRVSGDRLLAVVRSVKTAQRSAHDSLRALDQGNLALLWEYEDEGEFTGAPNTNGRFVAIAGASGDVVLFR